MPCPILLGPLPKTIIFFFWEGIDSLELSVGFIFFRNCAKLRLPNNFAGYFLKKCQVIDLSGLSMIDFVILQWSEIEKL